MNQTVDVPGAYLQTNEKGGGHFMLETSQRLNNKAILRIVRHPESKTDIATMDLVKGILYDQIYSVFQISASWSIFTKGGSFADAENLSLIHI